MIIDDNSNSHSSSLDFNFDFAKDTAHSNAWNMNIGNVDLSNLDLSIPNMDFSGLKNQTNVG